MDMNFCEGTCIFFRQNKYDIGFYGNQPHWKFIHNNYTFTFNRKIEEQYRNIIMETIDESWKQNLENFIIKNYEKMLLKLYGKEHGYDTFYWEFPSISEEKLFYLKLKIPEKIFDLFFESYNL